jgi:hypothetical protein
MGLILAAVLAPCDVRASCEDSFGLIQGHTEPKQYTALRPGPKSISIRVNVKVPPSGPICFRDQLTPPQPDIGPSAAVEELAMNCAFPPLNNPVIADSVFVTSLTPVTHCPLAIYHPPRQFPSSDPA